MLLHRRQASLSIGKSAEARVSGGSESRNASAASRNGFVETPVFCNENRLGIGSPSVVTPMNGSAIAASASWIRFPQLGLSIWGPISRADAPPRCRAPKPK